MAWRTHSPRHGEQPEAPEPANRLRDSLARWLGLGVGVSAIAGGLWLGWERAPAAAQATGSTVPAPAEPAVETCASVGVRLARGAFPAEGVPRSVVVRLFSTDADGVARLLIPQAYVLASVADEDGSADLSVLVRSGAGEGERVVTELSRANSDGSLSLAILYDVEPVQVLDDCRRR